LPVQLNRQEARRLVEGIARSRGYIHPDVLAAMAPEHRDAVEQALRNLRAMVATGVLTYD
jgi:hypothetical protein